MQDPLCAHPTLAATILLILSCLFIGCAAPSYDGSPIDQAAQTAIAEGNCPGAVVVIGQHDRIVFRRAYGQRAVEPAPEPMTADTIFDLASLTKPVATATAVALLVERGTLGYDDRVAAYLPSFAANGKETITIADLLLHTGGLPADNPLDDYQHGRDHAITELLHVEPVELPRTEFIYSDVGYMVLALVVERVAARPFDAFVRDELLRPIGMHDTRFCPPSTWRSRCAPCNKRNGQWIRGQVHDPRAYALGGVAGHAGLFGTADDLARYCQMLLNKGRTDDKRILEQATVVNMTQPHRITNAAVRTYGFDVDTAYSSARGDGFAKGISYGHTGFTGTSFWIDPAQDAFVIILTNRLHPDSKGNVIPLRHKIATIAAQTLTHR